MNILALDLATATGWACKSRLGVESGVQRFDLKRGESPGMRWMRFRRWMEELCCEYAYANPPTGNVFDLIVYEAPIVGMQKNAHAAHIAFNLAGRVEEFVASQGGECAPVHLGTLKKWATGKGNANKPAMVAEARRRHPDVEIIDDNQADALLLLDYALAELVPVAGRSE